MVIKKAKKKTKEEVLAERARNLSESSQDPLLNIKFSHAVIFRLANERYAIESKYISEVYPLIDVTDLPGVPAYVYGLMNVRRKIISIIDLKFFFHLPEDNEVKSRQVIVLEGWDMTFGILTDEVLGVKELNISEMQTQLSSFSGDRKNLTKGIVEESIILLDGQKLLNDEKLILSEKSLCEGTSLKSYGKNGSQVVPTWL